MNWQLLRYLIASYTRSYRYFAPFSFMIISVLLLYSYKPNPVMDSYAVTSTLLFMGFAWMGMTFLNHDQGRQTSLLLLHTGSAGVFYVTQYAVLVTFSAIMSTMAVIYPILTGMFNEPVGMERFVIAWLAHLLLSLLGSAISLYFQSGWIENQGRAIGLICIVVILSIAGLSVVSSLPGKMTFMAYILPPVSLMIDMLMHADEQGLIKCAWALLYTFGYTAVLFLVYLNRACTKDAAELVRKSG